MRTPHRFGGVCATFVGGGGEPGATTGLEELIGIADARMYAAKRAKASR